MSSEVSSTGGNGSNTDSQNSVMRHTVNFPPDKEHGGAPGADVEGLPILANDKPALAVGAKANLGPGPPPDGDDMMRPTQPGGSRRKKSKSSRVARKSRSTRRRKSSRRNRRRTTRK